MRGIYTPVTDIRRKVFTEVARMAYEVDDMQDYAYLLKELPYRIIPGEEGNMRSSIFLERAIVSERIRLAMGLSLRPINENVPATDNLEQSVIADKYYEPPLINVIKFACNKCPEKIIKVSQLCQSCLAHPCQEVCPKKAISFLNGRSHIDQEKCVKCGRCVNACPYGAIVKIDRPCAAACGMGAIHSDELGRADIDYNKCVSCGQCLVTCPFGAISDKGQIFQLIHAMKAGERVYAAVAPAFVGQFGPKITPEKLRAAIKALGFADVIEVAVGADLCAVSEAKEFVEQVPDTIPFMGTSCCPAWSVMAKKNFPQYQDCISMTLTPMVLTGRLIKKQHPNAKVAFIGPCSAKKLEASRRTVRSDVDFVLTFEEMMGLFEAKNIDMASIQEEPVLSETSTDGRNFAVSGGVAKAVVNCVNEMYPGREVKVVSAQGLADCRKMLQLAKAGKYNGYLLEGMACPGGCVAGPGTMQPINKSTAAVNMYARKAVNEYATTTEYLPELEKLEE